MQGVEYVHQVGDQIGLHGEVAGILGNLRRMWGLSELIGGLFFFNRSHPSGRYCLDLAKVFDRVLLSRIIEISEIARV